MKNWTFEDFEVFVAERLGSREAEETCAFCRQVFPTITSHTLQRCVCNTCLPRVRAIEDEAIRNSNNNLH